MNKAYTSPDNRIHLFCGDALAFMRGQADASYDAIITDWPYNAGMEYADDPTGDRLAYLEYRAFADSWLRQALRIAPVVAFTPGIANLGMWAEICPPVWVYCWHKPAAMGRCKVGFNNWEPILFYGKPGKAHSDVIAAPIITVKGLDWHPCPKPREWAAALLKRFCPAGGNVLDTFCGSGTLLEAAKFGGWRATGVERSPFYCSKIADRLRQEALFQEAV